MKSEQKHDGTPVIQVLSLGAGVQSSALLLMSCHGVLPKLTAAIFADTGWEPKEVYRNLAFLESEAKRCGIQVYRVSGGNLREMALRARADCEPRRFVTMPLYVKNPNASRGMLRRQCTHEFKIRPIERCLRRQILGLRPRQHAPKHIVVSQWMGISADEASRARESQDKWREFVYPLLGLPRDYLPKPMTRADCWAWLAEHYPGRTFPRSACIGCPFHNDQEWRNMRDQRPEDFKDAIQVDTALRVQRGLKGQAFLHASRRPLKEVDLQDKDKQTRQISLWDDECSGLCGV